MNKADSSYVDRHWKHIFQSLADGLLVVDPENRVQFMNEGAAALTGVSAARASRRPLRDVLGPNAWAFELVETARTTGAPSVRGDVDIRRRDGQECPVRAAATPIVDDDATRVGVLLTLHDLRYQKEVDARLRDDEQMGRLEILLAGLAHEVKNPLSGMRGAAQLLSAADPGSRRARECTEIIVDEVDRLNGLMSQLLDLTGPPKTTSEPVNIHEILDRVVAIERAARPDGPRFERRFDPSLPPVRGDPGRITQVFLNLVQNAVDASPPDSVVTLATRMETSFYVSDGSARSRFLSVDVHNEGPGIPPEQLDQIFSPFFTTKSEGTGLGLAICQRIVTEHGGALRAFSEPKCGATFTATLPLES